MTFYLEYHKHSIKYILSLEIIIIFYVNIFYTKLCIKKIFSYLKKKNTLQ